MMTICMSAQLVQGMSVADQVARIADVHVLKLRLLARRYRAFGRLLTLSHLWTIFTADFAGFPMI